MTTLSYSCNFAMHNNKRLLEPASLAAAAQKAARRRLSRSLGGKSPRRTAARGQPEAGTVETFQDAQRFRPARRTVSRTTPSATMAAVESSGAGDAVALGSRLAKDMPFGLS